MASKSRNERRLAAQVEDLKTQLTNYTPLPKPADKAFSEREKEKVLRQILRLVDALPIAQQEIFRLLLELL